MKSVLQGSVLAVVVAVVAAFAMSTMDRSAETEFSTENARVK